MGLPGPCVYFTLNSPVIYRLRSDDICGGYVGRAAAWFNPLSPSLNFGKGLTTGTGVINHVLQRMGSAGKAAFSRTVGLIPGVLGFAVDAGCTLNRWLF